MVVIIDPHLKRTNDYPVYTQATELDVLVKKSDGTTDYEGWCWSGSSAWVDFFNPKSWDWWKSLYKVQPQGDQWSWIESTVDTGIWNDMNEVSPPPSLPVTSVRISDIRVAFGLQWSGNQYAARKYPLWRLGTPRRPQS